MVMVGAALSREFIANECAPTATSNMSGEKVSSQFSSGLLELCKQSLVFLRVLRGSILGI